MAASLQPLSPDGSPVSQIPPPELPGALRRWYAVYTYPQHEKSSCKHLAERGVDVFYPTYSREKVWKNRQRVKLQLALFPSYLFVHIHTQERGLVLGTPGVLRLLGNSSGPQAIPDKVVDLLRYGLANQKIEPHSEILPGQRVRICRGPMQGMEGALVRRKNTMWFVISLDVINQRAMVEVKADDLEPVQA